MSNEKSRIKREKDFHLDSEHYEELGDETVYSEEHRVGKIFGVRNKSTKLSNEPYISAQSQYEFGKWMPNRGFNIHSPSHMPRLILALKTIAKKLGWKFKVHEENIEAIKTQLQEKESLIIDLQRANLETRKEHEELLKAYLEQKNKLMRSRIEEFKKTINELRKKIQDADTKSIKECELQEFLYINAWLFGTEYISAQPQKLRGAHSKFDFYLERFNKTNDIIEIKLLSEPIVNQDEGVSAKVIQAVDQLIEYLESATAAAHSTVISEEEGIKELRPRGIVVIGKDQDKKARDKLEKWNYRLSHIQIMTYYDVLKRAEAVVKNIEKQEVVPNE